MMAQATCLIAQAIVWGQLKVLKLTMQGLKMLKMQWLNCPMIYFNIDVSLSVSVLWDVVRAECGDAQTGKNTFIGFFILHLFNFHCVPFQREIVTAGFWVVVAFFFLLSHHCIGTSKDNLCWAAFLSVQVQQCKYLFNWNASRLRQFMPCMTTDRWLGTISLSSAEKLLTNLESKRKVFFQCLKRTYCKTKRLSVFERRRSTAKLRNSCINYSISREHRG